MTVRIVIVGAGGHASVLADALLAAGADVLGFTDADPARRGRWLCGRAVLGGDEVLDAHSPRELQLVNGIGSVGDPRPRRGVQAALVARGWRFAGVRHPSAVLSPHATLAADVQLLARSVVNPGARIGAGCIVNTGAIVEHDVQLGEFCHVAPGAVLCGDVVVGEGSHVGAGAVVRQGVRLGAGSVIGAGAVVVKDFEGGGTLAGLPARRMERKA